MKIVNYLSNGAMTLGLLDTEKETIARIAGPDGQEVSPEQLNRFLEHTMMSDHGYVARAEHVRLEEVQLLAPIPHPQRNVFCVGKNYVEHAKEFDSSGYDTSVSGKDSAIPEVPIVFTKPPSTIIGPDAEIDPHPEVTQALDYEAEVAIVIGRPGKAISPEDAWSHVWGMMLVNDVTARDVQMRHKQWFLGKCLDTFLPSGPWLVSMDELRDHDIVLEGRVNGELRQRASMQDLIFDVPTIISTISAGMALQVGDVIATGTPAGVGIGMTPPQFLQPGDVIEVSATGLGHLRNMVSRGPSGGPAGDGVA